MTLFRVKSQRAVTLDLTQVVLYFSIPGIIVNISFQFIYVSADEEMVMTTEELNQKLRKVYCVRNGQPRHLIHPSKTFFSEQEQFYICCDLQAP